MSAFIYDKTNFKAVNIIYTSVGIIRLEINLYNGLTLIASRRVIDRWNDNETNTVWPKTTGGTTAVNFILNIINTNVYYSVTYIINLTRDSGIRNLKYRTTTEYTILYGNEKRGFRFGDVRSMVCLVRYDDYSIHHMEST